MNCGKHFIVGFDSLVLTKELKTKLLQLQPAGIILYDCNIESKEQVKKLISDLKDLLGEELLVSVDQEGGKVQRLRKICPDLPSYKALGMAAKKDFSYVKKHAALLASELVELGFNLVYAPCADLNTNPFNPIIGTRSLGQESELVSRCLVEIHNTYRDYGLISCAKHFPGHGDAGIDSHLDLPLVKRTKEENEYHIKPFKTLIDNEIETIMIAHLVVNQGLPTSINPEIIKLLKKDLGFKGLVISDEITMKALSQFGDYTQITKQLLEAGIDLIIWNTNLDDAVEAARHIKEPHNSNVAISQQRLISSVKEIATVTSFPRNDSMLEIAKLGIEVKNPFILSDRDPAPTAQDDNTIIINNHPKLEKKLIESSLQGIDRKILIEFQISDQELKSIKEKHPNIIHVSTDICNPEADICLNGASLSHYLALKNLL